MTRALTCLVSLLPALALAQGVLTRAPALVGTLEVPYPPEQLQQRVGGAVVLELELSDTGAVVDVKVAESSGVRALDEAARGALARARFTPAELDGQKAAVKVQYRHEFVPPAPEPAGPPPVNLEGTLRAAGTREPVAGALVTAGELEAVTDAAGHFELAGVPAGTVKVLVSAPGFERFESDELVVAGERTSLRYVLRGTGEQQRETVVRDVRERREVARVKLTQAEVKVVAGAHGDAFRVIQNLPGVARSPFGAGVLIVRGSKAWDSRTYVDDVLIPQLFHYGGITATFNSALLDDVTFQPGNFGSEFGRSIGGLVRAQARTPSKTGLHGYADVNPFDVSAMVEAPISPTWSVSASARRALTDLTVPFALRTFAPQALNTVGFTLAPISYDYQLRAERRVAGSSNRVFVAVYGSSDAWAFTVPNPFLDPESEGNQGSFGTTVLYNRLTLGVDHRLGPNVVLTSRNSIGLDRSTISGATTDITYRDTEVPVQLREKLTFQIPESHLELSAGLDFLSTPIFVEAQSPPTFHANQIPDPYVERQLVAERSQTTYHEPGVYLDATWTPVSSVVVSAGVRADVESKQGHAWVDPRLAVRFTPWEPLTLKAAAGVFHQPADYRAGQLSPTFGNPALLPEGARHFTAGAEARFTDALELDVQGYYKDLFDQARQTLSSGLGSDINIPGAETRYTSKGYGRSYGAEVLLRHKPKHHFFGWVAYSISRFERDYYGGVAYAPGPLDQPHNLIVVGSYQLPWDITVGVKLRFASGPLVTPIVASLYDGSGNYYYPLPGLPWSQRLPNFFQLDARIDKRFVFEKWTLDIYADVQNVTNRANAEGVFYNYNYTQKQIVSGVPILPALGARGEF